MANINYALVIQLTVSLGIAFYLVRKLRDPIRAAVVRMMPIKHRISDESFTMQTRFSTLAAFVIGLILTGLIYWGTEELVELVSPAGSRQESTRITPKLPDAATPLSILPGPVQPEIKDRPEPYDTTDTISTSPGKPIQALNPKAGGRPAEALYIQLYAFEQAERAYEQQLYFGGLLSQPVSVVRVSGSIGPFKVVVGPFPDTDAARSFLTRNRLKGFLRWAKELDI